MKLLLLMSHFVVTLHLVKMEEPSKIALLNDLFPPRPVEVLCSGVYVAPKTVMTAGHCVSALYKDKLWVKTEGKTYSASVVLYSKERDLALLHVAGVPHEFVRIGNSPNKLDDVYTYNSSYGMEGTYGKGYVTNLIRDERTNEPNIVTSIGIYPGASGGGLFDKSGYLIGIWSTYLPGFSFAVETSTLKAFMADGDGVIE